MKEMDLAFLPLVWAACAYTAQGSLISPRLPNRSNATTPVAKVNATIPVVTYQSHKVKAASNQTPSTITDAYYYEVMANGLPEQPKVQKVRTGCRTPICGGSVDTIVLVDVSGSVGDDGIAKVKSMLHKLPYHFHGPSDEHDTRQGQFLALMSYGQQVKILTQWTDDREAFKAAADKLTVEWSSGDLGGGLTRAAQLLRYARPESYHNVLVITDGGATSRVKANQAAQQLSQQGAVLYMLVIEDHVGCVHDEAVEALQATGQMPVNKFMMGVQSYRNIDNDDTVGETVYNLCPSVVNLVSVGSKVTRTVMNGNRTASTQSKKLRRNFRKI